MLEKIVFVLHPAWQNTTGPEVRTAREELSPEGLSVTSTDEVPTAPAPQTLYLTDSADAYEALQAAGCPAIGYLHRDNAGETFEHCPYLLSEPQWVDADSYQKIYERLTGQPWTILTTDRLVVREMTVDDLDALYALYDEEARRFMTPPDDNHDVERARLRDYIDKVYGLFGYGYWALVDKASGQLIGRMGFSTEQSSTYGYLIHKEYRRQGYAAEAARAMLPYARNVLGLEEIRAEVHNNNVPSIEFLQSLGFRKVGVQNDLEIYAI